MHQSQCLILWHSLQVRLDTASPRFRIQMVDLFTVKFWVVLRRWFFSGTLPLKAGEAPQQSPIKAWFRRILNITGRQNLNHWFSGELVALFFSIQRQQRQNLWGPYNWLASKSKRSWESRAQVFEVTCTGESDSNSEWRAKGRRSQNLNFCYGHFCFHRHCHYYCYCSGSCNYYWHHHYHDWYEHHYTFNIAYNIYIYI